MVSPPLSRRHLHQTTAITWNNPADIVLGTALSDTQLNATASAPGSFVYTPSAGVVLSVGAGQTLHVDFTPDDTTNYTHASKDVRIDVIYNFTGFFNRLILYPPSTRRTPARPSR
jgi:hypothetical protein